MNFYEFYRLLNEYGQTLIQTLIKKFQEEVPTLTPTIIRNYIDRFENIKNNLPEKDITKYSWKQLENTVDSYQPKQRIKAGKIDPTVSDANLLYNKDGIRIYLGKDKKSCIKYSNGYTFCIGARGPDNMYSHYRISNKGTPYFIFNDNLPKNDKRHLMVLIVYDKEFIDFVGAAINLKRYSVTLATNNPDDEKQYSKLEEIIKLYPWTKSLENFVDDENKGTVEVGPLEVIESKLEQAFNQKIYDLRYMGDYNVNHIMEILNKNDEFLKNYRRLQSSLNDDKKNLISINVKNIFLQSNGNPAESTVSKFNDYENIEELENDLKTLIEMVLDNSDLDDNKDIKNLINLVGYKNNLLGYIKNNQEVKEVFNKISGRIACVLKYSAEDGGEKISGDVHRLIRKANEKYHPNKDGFTTVITLFSKQFIKYVLDQSSSIHLLADAYKEYYAILNWLKQRTPEQLKEIEGKLPEPESWDEDFPTIFYNVLASFRNKQ